MLTRTGSIRKGFGYQDTYALLKIAEWIANPNQFTWMKIEAREAGFLDDVIVSDARTDSIWLFQIKYGVHPDAPESEWDFETLLSARKSRTKPLFTKWFESWLEFKSKGFPSVFGALVTNRPASVHLKKCLKASGGGQQISTRVLQKAFPRKYKQALKQVGGGKGDLDSFLRSFVFYFDRPDLEVTKEQVRQQLERFGVNEKGWHDLQDAVRDWATHRDRPRADGIIRLGDARAGAGWTSPKSVEQEFPIPLDFVLANQSMHRHLIRRVKSSSGGIVVIAGTPGSGKSTYLSYLEGKLKISGHICLRHHYFVRFDDPDRYRRLTPDVARESLLHDLLAIAPESLGDKRFHNPNPKELGAYIRLAAKYFHQQGRSLIVIVDGLDHVLSERESRELRDLLEDLVPVPEGLWLVLGTRPIAAAHLPRAVLERAPEANWLVMPGLTPDGCRELLWWHRKQLHLDSSDYLNELGLAFFNRTKGHALYSRLCLTVLLDRATLGYITKHDVQNLVPFTGEIRDMYEGIWQRLSAEAKHVAVLLAVTGLPLDASHVIDCLTARAESASSVLAGLNELSPVLIERAGKKALFHFSFSEYVRRTDEFSALRLSILKSFRDWLFTSAPTWIRWQNLTSVEFQLGNYSAVVDDLSRNWVIQSLCDFRSIDQIIEQLRSGVHAAMELNDFGRAHMLGMLRQYLSWAVDSDNEALDKVSLLAWRNNVEAPAAMPPPDEIPNFSNEGLIEIGREAARSAQKDALNRIVHQLSIRSGNVRSYDYGDDWWKNARALSEAWAIAKQEVSNFVEWAVQFRERGRSVDLLRTYAKSLEATNQATSLKKLLSSRLLVEAERTQVLDGIAEVLIQKSVKDWSYFHQYKHETSGPWSSLYLALLGRSPSEVKMPDPRTLADPEREFLEGHEERQYQSAFTGVYLASLALTLAGEGIRLSKWVSRLNVGVWSHRAANLVAQIGPLHGKSLLSGTPPLYEAILEILDQFEVPTFPEDRSIWSAWKAFRKTIEDLVFATADLRHWAGASARQQLSVPMIRRMRDSEFFGRYSIQTILLNSRLPLLEPEEIGTFLIEEQNYWRTTVESFYERGKTYADLSSIAYKYNLVAQGRTLLEKAAQNALGYGYHKDLYLDEVLNSIEACRKAGSTRVREWIPRIAPIVQSVLDFTDGDETRHLPRYLGKVLRKVSVPQLRSYYADSVEREELFLAEDIFSELISATDFTNGLEIAVASTATDEDSIARIDKSIVEGKPGARELMSSLITVYHRLSEPKSKKPDSALPSFKSTDIDVTVLDTIQPSEIRKRLETESTRYDKNRLLKAWLDVWLRKQEKSRTVYDLTLEWIDLVGPENVEADIYDLLEPYADEFEIAGSDKAFDFFCRAYANAHGWIWYFQDFSKIEPRWNRLQGAYPGRWREFISRTCALADGELLSNRMTSLSIPRGTEFLARFGTLAEAENLTDSAVATLQQLMADLQLPKASWVDREPPADVWDVLYCRLMWPSPIVRERAASALCELLLDPSVSGQAVNQLYIRLKATNMESLTTLILLPLAKAIRTNARAVPIDRQRLKDSIARPSVVSEQLLLEIEQHLGVN